MTEQPDEFSILASIDIQAKARVCRSHSALNQGVDYTHALEGAIDEANRLLARAGIPMNENHALAIATRFLAENVLSGLDRPLEGPALIEWLRMSYVFLWEERIQGDPEAPLPGYQLERMAMEAVAGGRSSTDFQVDLDAFLNQTRSAMARLLSLIPVDMRSYLLDSPDRMNELASHYFEYFRDPSYFIPYVLENIEMLCHELFESSREAASCLPFFRERVRERLLPRFGPLLLFHKKAFAKQLGRPLSAEITPERVLDECVAYWAGNLPAIGQA